MQFENKNTKKISKEFLNKGYLIKDIKNIKSLEWISQEYKKIYKDIIREIK